MASGTLKIAAVTMVRGDDFFLQRWVEHYGACLGKENLYVLFDGEDQTVPSFCDGVNVRKYPHRPSNVHQGDRIRIKIISGVASKLFSRYDAVIGTDADEYLVPDPAAGETLTQMISRIAGQQPGWCSLSALGIDVGQDMRDEKEELALDRPFLSIRRKAKLSTRYSKASVLLRPAVWGSGFHRVKGHNYHIIRDLYLFHFGVADFARLAARMNDSALAAEGWRRHLGKRAGTIKLCSTKRPLDWDRAVKAARMLQTIVRPPYAWNKPAMFELRLVVRIPERFRDIL